MRSIWAVVTNTLKQALRMKIAATFVILLIILLPVMGFMSTGDGTLKGRLQTFVSYGLSLASFLLCILTIVVSVYSITNDIKQKQIFTVLTKPIRRFQFLLGKLLGVLLLDTALLILFSGVIYTITVYTPKLCHADQDELAKVNNEFFTARARLTPAEVDVAEEVRQAYEKLKKTGRLPEGSTRDGVIKKLTRDRKRWKRAAVPGRDVVLDFYNVKPIDPNQSLFVRFKYEVSVNPPDLQVSGKWLVGDLRQITIETPVYPFERKDLIRTFYEIEVPADAVAEDGYLGIAFFNDPQLNNTVVMFPTEENLEVLYKADTFTANFVRAVLLIFFRLIFLACLGILASTFLSFPVAVLLCLVVFFTGTISGFILESLDTIGEGTSQIYFYTIKPVIQLLPQFDKYSPAKFLVPARLLSWFVIVKVAGLMVCVKAVLSLALSLLIFSHREIAKITI